MREGTLNKHPNQGHLEESKEAAPVEVNECYYSGFPANEKRENWWEMSPPIIYMQSDTIVAHCEREGYGWCFEFPASV